MRRRRSSPRKFYTLGSHADSMQKLATRSYNKMRDIIGAWDATARKLRVALTREDPKLETRQGAAVADALDELDLANEAMAKALKHISNVTSDLGDIRW